MHEKSTKPFAITPVYDLLLHGDQKMPVGLYDLRLATAEQLCRLFYKPGMLKTVKKRLKVLADNGFVQADCIPTKRFKSPYYYALDTKGMRYLESIGFDTDAAFRPDKAVSESYLHIRHALELNDVVIAAWRLKDISNNPCYVHEHRDERKFKREPLKFSYDGSDRQLIPDGFLDIRIRRNERNLRLPLLVELDRGTEQKEHFQRRIRMYKALLSSGAYQQLSRINSVTVAFTTFISEKRVHEMRGWTLAELADAPQLATVFRFAELPQPLEPQHLLFEPRWYSVTDGQPEALFQL